MLKFFLLKLAPFCRHFAGFDSTNKSSISLLSFPVLSGYNGSPDTCFSWRTTRLMSWPDGERYSHPLQFFVASLLFFYVSTFFFSRTGGVLSHRNSSTHMFPRFSPRNFCSLAMFTVFSLVYAATDTAYC